MSSIYQNTILCLVLLILSTSSLYAEDWYEWRGPYGDGFSREKGILTQWPSKGLPEVWRTPLGEGYSGISVYQGLVYTLIGDGTFEYCLALDEKNGKVVWQVQIGYFFHSGIGSGPRANPVISDDKIYALSANGDFWCLNAKTGKKIWNFNILKRFKANNMGWGICATPLVYKNMILYNVGAGEGKSLVALNKDTGETVWTSQDDSPSYGSPIMARFEDLSYALFYTGDGLVGINPENGEALWRYPWQMQNGVNSAVPMVHDNYIFMSSSYGKGSSLIQLSRQNGKFEVKEVYKTRKMQVHFTNMIFWKGYLYGFHNKILSCLDYKTGKVKWRERGFDRGSMVGLMSGHVIILGEKGNLGIVKMDPEKYISTGYDHPFASTVCFTAPTLANGKLFLRNQKEMVCLDLQAGR